MDKNAQKSFSFSARGAAADPAGEAMTLPRDLLVRWGGKYLLPISFPVNAFGVLISGRFFSARCYASAVLAVGLCPCPCSSVSVCPSQVGVLLKQQRRITQTTPHDRPGESSFLMPKISAKFDRGHPLRGRRMQVGWSKSATLNGP